MKLDIGNIESVVMDSELTRKFKELNVVEETRKELDGVLYAIGYEEPTFGGTVWFRRYHKVALFGAYASLTFHDSNVIDANITLKIEDVVKEVKNTLNHIIKEI